MCPLSASPPEIFDCEADSFLPAVPSRIRFASSRCGRSPYVLRHGRSALMQARVSLPCRRPHGSLNNKTTLYLFFLRKEVIQPHLPIRLPCYDFTPVTGSTFDSSLLIGWVTGFGHFRLPWCDGRCVQDPGTYSPRHSDSRLLAIPASCSRVADYSPNWDGLFVVRSPSRVRLTL